MLNTISEEIYIRQPLGFEGENEEKWVYRLKCSFYGLKQASRSWNGALYEELIIFDF